MTDKTKANLLGIGITAAVLVVVWKMGGFNAANAVLPSNVIIPGALASSIKDAYNAGPTTHDVWGTGYIVTRREAAEYHGKFCISLARHVEADGKTPSPRINSDSDFDAVRGLATGSLPDGKTGPLAGAWPQIGQVASKHFGAVFGDEFSKESWTAERRGKFVAALREFGEASLSAAKGL